MLEYTKRQIKCVDDLPSSLRSRSGWAEMFELQRGLEPHIHQIEPTNACPYDCIMCPRSKKMTRKVGYMDMTIYHKVIDEISSFSEPIRLKEIELFHFGESLLHPKVVEMITYGSERDLKIVLSVNAPHLTPEKSDRILDANPLKIILSLDGYDEESYRAIRGKSANYTIARQHIDYILERHSRISSKTEIIIRMIQLKENMHYSDQFKKTWEKRGVTVELREFFPWTENDLEQLGMYKRYPPFMPCPFPWQYMVVQWDGSVVPCCRDFNAENIIGHVSDNTLTDIWNSELYRLFRENHSCGNFTKNRICTECMKMYYSEG